jgi:hypothetical protein
MATGFWVASSPRERSRSCASTHSLRGGRPNPLPRRQTMSSRPCAPPVRCLPIRVVGAAHEKEGTSLCGSRFSPEARSLEGIDRTAQPGQDGGFGVRGEERAEAGSNGRTDSSLGQPEIRFLLHSRVSALAVVNIKNAQPLLPSGQGVATHAVVVYTNMDSAVINAAS